MRHVVFRVEPGWYALPLASVREVVPMTEALALTKVPRAPRALHGVVNLRGRVVPVVQLWAVLDAPAPQAVPTQLLLLDRGRRELALLVTAVEGIESLDKAVASSTPASRAVRGVYRLGARAVTSLDLDALDAMLAGQFAKS